MEFTDLTPESRDGLATELETARRIKALLMVHFPIRRGGGSASRDGDAGGGGGGLCAGSGAAGGGFAGIGNGAGSAEGCEKEGVGLGDGM